MNEVTLIGNVGEINYENKKEGKECCIIFSLATSKKWKDSAGNEVVKTEWHKIIANGLIAYNMSKFIGKGSRMFIKGDIRYSEFTDKKGNKQYSTSIHVQTYINGIKD